MRIMLVLVLMCAGCAFFSETQQPDILPELVYRTALPPVPADWAASHPKIEVLFHVSRVGTVTETQIVKSSGDDAWESKALVEMKQWRFSPARLGLDSVPVWVRVPINVRFADMKVLNLAQLVCADQSCADSAYRLLLASHQFDTVVRELPDSGHASYVKTIGETDITVYSEEIQKELAKLKENEFTMPIRLGGLFVIFKRLPASSASGM